MCAWTISFFANTFQNIKFIECNLSFLSTHSKLAFQRTQPFYFFNIFKLRYRISDRQQLQWQHFLFTNVLNEKSSNDNKEIEKRILAVAESTTNNNQLLTMTKEHSIHCTNQSNILCIRHLKDDFLSDL